MTSGGTRIRANRPEDAERIVQIWCTSVDATHDFLSAGDRLSIEALVAEHISKANLDLLVDETDTPLAFLKMDGETIDAMFVAGDRLGQGLGSIMMHHAIDKCGARVLEVNEQNSQALAFYKRGGFEVTSGVETDDHGRPYPTSTMTLAA